MTSISQYVYLINQMTQLLNTAIHMKYVDVKPSMYIDFNKEKNKAGPQFEIGDQVRISKYTKNFQKKIFQKYSAMDRRYQ